MSDQQHNAVKRGLNPRIGKISKNFFMHIHAAKSYPYVFKPGFTLGLGMILGFLFLVMAATGVILLIHYVPSVDRAYDSVKDIIYTVPGGRVIRNLHRFSANVMVLVTLLHLMRVFFTGGYQDGREANWVVGVILFLLVLFMNFSGYLLPWDQLSFWAVTIGSNIAGSFRELTDLLGITNWFDPGRAMQFLILGGSEVGQVTLSRFFMLHVVFLPIAMLTLVLLHLWRIRKDGGLNIPEFAREEKKIYAWPLLPWIEVTLFAGLLVLLISASFFVDAPLMAQADPAHPDNPAKSPWYFLGIQELVSHSAFAGGILIPSLFLWFLFSIPFVDRETEWGGVWFSGSRGVRAMLRGILFGLLLVSVQYLVLIRFGWLRDWFGNIPQWVILLINPATITAGGILLYGRFIARKESSTRLAAIGLFSAAMVALILFTAIGIWFRVENWEFGLAF